MKVVQSGILGDVDNNGQVDMNDGFLVMMYFADSSVSMPTAAILPSAMSTATAEPTG